MAALISKSLDEIFERTLTRSFTIIGVMFVSVVAILCFVHFSDLTPLAKEAAIWVTLYFGVLSAALILNLVVGTVRILLSGCSITGAKE